MQSSRLSLRHRFEADISLISSSSSDLADSQVDKFYIEKKDDMDISSLLSIGVESSVAGAILHQRSGSSLASFLKQSEQYSWTVYMLRFRILQGEGDSDVCVSKRAISMTPVEPHESVRGRRCSGDRRLPRPTILDDNEDGAESDHLDESDNHELVDIPSDGSDDPSGRRLTLRKKVRT